MRLGDPKVPVAVGTLLQLLLLMMITTTPLGLRGKKSDEKENVACLCQEGKNGSSECFLHSSRRYCAAAIPAGGLWVVVGSGLCVLCRL